MQEKELESYKMLLEEALKWAELDGVIGHPYTILSDDSDYEVIVRKIK